MTVGPDDILAFWNALGPGGWYAVDDVVDAAIRDRFHPAWRAARGGAFRHWCTTPEGALAYLILTDQFPRNMFRGSSDAFATDALALGAARGALLRGHDLQIAPPARQFFCLPLMHSEALADQDRCLALFRERMPDPGNVRHAGDAVTYLIEQGVLGVALPPADIEAEASSSTITVPRATAGTVRNGPFGSDRVTSRNRACP